MISAHRRACARLKTTLAPSDLKKGIQIVARHVVAHRRRADAEGHIVSDIVQ